MDVAEQRKIARATFGDETKTVDKTDKSDTPTNTAERLLKPNRIILRNRNSLDLRTNDKTDALVRSVSL